MTRVMASPVDALQMTDIVAESERAPEEPRVITLQVVDDRGVHTQDFSAQVSPIKTQYFMSDASINICAITAALVAITILSIAFIVFMLIYYFNIFPHRAVAESISPIKQCKHTCSARCTNSTCNDICVHYCRDVCTYIDEGYIVVITEADPASQCLTSCGYLCNYNRVGCGKECDRYCRFMCAVNRTMM